jgi:polysaccharide export outer membrane protein
MKVTALTAALFVLFVSLAQAQTKSAPQTATAKPQAASTTTVTPPPDYVIGPGDVLTVTFRDEKDMTGDYLVRPDGKITMPLLGDIEVVKMTPEQVTERLVKTSTAKDLFVNPTVSVGAKEINSRLVYITGGVVKPGPVKLLSPMNVVQLIAIAGSFREWVDTSKIVILRNEEGKQPQLLKFNYKEFLEGKNLDKNVWLKPGDTVSVPEPD